MSKCEHKKRECIDSRRFKDFTRRRYSCKTCGEIYTTAEVEVSVKCRNKGVMEALKNTIMEKYNLIHRDDDNLRKIAKILTPFLNEV